jgi:HPt (histidine-containing phosphotransfer) domain-containing protein
VADDELLGLLASETDRRGDTIVKGVRKLAGSGKQDPKGVEALRVEAHGLKGAAMVVGQKGLADLARQLEITFAERAGSGTIEPETAERVVAGIAALREGAQAAADGGREPKSVKQARKDLGG